MTLYRYEVGAHTPSMDIIERIADALDVSVDYLLGRDEVVVYDRDAEPPPTAYFEFLKHLAPSNITENEKRMLREMRAYGGKFTPQTYVSMLMVMRGSLEPPDEETQKKIDALDDV